MIDAPVSTQVAWAYPRPRHKSLAERVVDYDRTRPAFTLAELEKAIMSMWADYSVAPVFLKPTLILRTPWHPVQGRPIGGWLRAFMDSIGDPSCRPTSDEFSTKRTRSA